MYLGHLNEAPIGSSDIGKYRTPVSTATKSDSCENECIYAGKGAN